MANESPRKPPFRIRPLRLCLGLLAVLAMGACSIYALYLFSVDFHTNSTLGVVFVIVASLFLWIAKWALTATD